MGRVVKGVQVRVERYQLSVPEPPPPPVVAPSAEFAPPDAFDDAGDGLVRGAGGVLVPAIDVDALHAEAQALVEEAQRNAEALLEDAHHRARALVEDAAARAGALSDDAR